MARNREKRLERRFSLAAKAKTRDKLAALAPRLVFGLLRMMPPLAAMALLGGVLSVVGPRLDRSRRMRRTLELAFPDLDRKAREARVRSIWRSFGHTLASIPHLDSFKAGTRGTRVRAGGMDVLAELRGRAFIACGAHVGNWEAMAALPPEAWRATVISYNPQENPVMEATIQRYRAVTGAEFVRKEHIPRMAARTLREGKIFYFTIDQRVEQGEEISFLGLPALASRLPARLAVKYRCPIVPVEAIGLGAGQLEAHFHKPLWPDERISDPEERSRELMIRMFREIEAIVLRNPDQWFCLKARWSRREAARIHADRPAAERRARKLAVFKPISGP